VKSNYLTNIGLTSSPNYPEVYSLTLENVETACRFWGVGFTLLKTAQSETEQTLVCRLYADRDDLWTLALSLSQDCIACVPCDASNTPNGEGFLIGPFDEQWGSFNPEFFILP
jgi:hypothetical protein